MRLRLPLGALLATVLVVPTTVVLPTLTVGRDAPRPVPPVLHTLPLGGVDASALRSEPVPRALADRLAQARGLPPATAARRAAQVTPAVLTARTATDQFALVGVTWLPGPASLELAAAVRTRTDGSWSRWHELEQLADTAGGDEAAEVTRMGTAPRWVGDSDGVQVRVDVLAGQLPDGLRIDLIDPGTSPADDDVGAAPPAGSAAAAAARPDIITRAEWGADESLRDQNLAMSRTIKASFVHHTAGSNSYTRAQAPAVVRGLLAYSTGSVGYADIPYNFLVDKFGRIYEGRAGSITGAVRQGATGGFNTDTMSVVAMGNFVSRAAPDVMVNGIARILAYRLSAYHRNPLGTKVLVTEDGPSRYSVGQKVRFDVISGHRDAGYTACPGTRLYQRLPEIRRTAKRLMGANFVEPSLSTHKIAYGEPTVVTARSRSLAAMDWRLTVTRACQNTVVATRSGTVAPGSPLSVQWRGRDDQGRPVPAGRYQVTLSGGSSTSTATTWRSGVQVQVGSPAPPATTSLLPPPPAGRYVAVTPRRLAATAGGFGLAAPVLLGADSRIRVPVLGRGGVPSSKVSAVAVSVLASCAGRDTSLSVGPSTVRSGAAFAVSVDGGESARGLAVSGLGPDGAITVRNARGTVSAALSVVGYWTTAGGGDGFVPLPPATVPGTGAGLGVGPSPVTVDVAGTAGVPAGADAAVVNVRRRGGSSASSVWVWPANAARPSIPSLRRSAGQAAQQRVVVPLAGDGRVRVAADQPGRVTLDVVGYLAGGGSGFHPVAPRVVTAGGLRVGPGSTSRPSVGGAAGVPRSADAVVLQLSASRAQRPTRLFVFPAGTSRPGVADLTVPRRVARTNLVVVPLGTKGRVAVRSIDAAADVSMVVMGWFG